MLSSQNYCLVQSCRALTVERVYLGQLEAMDMLIVKFNWPVWRRCSDLYGWLAEGSSVLSEVS